MCFQLKTPQRVQKPPIPGLTRTTGMTSDRLQMAPITAPIVRLHTPMTSETLTAAKLIILGSLLFMVVLLIVVPQSVRPEFFRFSAYNGSRNPE